MQMAVNFSLVSLSVLEAMEARKDPKVVAQFAVLMLLALGHLSMWCVCGDMLSQKSLKISEAAYEAYDPTRGSKENYRLLCLIIRRAQNPLIMRASPFPSFNLRNYTAVRSLSKKSSYVMYIYIDFSDTQSMLWNTDIFIENLGLI